MQGLGVGCSGAGLSGSSPRPRSHTAWLLLACVLACGPSTPGEDGSGEGSGGESSTTGDPLGWSCGDGIVVTGEYCFRELTLPGVVVTDIGIGDLDRDARDEIVVQTADELRSYAVHDDGTFALLQSWGDGESGNKEIVVGDFDRDGRRDVLRTVLEDTAYYRQLDDGTMELATDIDAATGPHWGGSPPLVFDVDLDGHEDYLLPIYDPGLELGPRRRAGHHVAEGAWVPIGTALEFWSSGNFGVVADVDGDGHAEPILMISPDEAAEPDPLVPASFDWEAVYLARVEADGSGLTLGGKLRAGFYPTGIDVGDVDGDGHLDIILDSKSQWIYDEGAQLHVIYWGHGDFTFDGPEPLDEVQGSLFDVDGDGVDELLDEEYIWRHIDGGFSRSDQPQPLIDAALSDHRGDLNGDGVDDYVGSKRPLMGEPVTNENSALVVALSDP